MYIENYSDNKVSILLPTRSRFDLFKKSVNSLYEMASKHSNFEILVALDSDDQETIEKVQDFKKNRDNIKTKIYERQGYGLLHNYQNDLFKDSEGTSIFLWNDDLKMETRDWDVKIIEHHKDFCILSPMVSNMFDYWKNQGMLFPVIPRKLIDLTGRLASFSADSWLNIVGMRLGIIKNIDNVSVYHDRVDLTNNNNDATWQESLQWRGKTLPPWKQEMEKDVQKINEYLVTLPNRYISLDWPINPDFAKNYNM